MFWDYFRWTREVEKGMECIGNRMPFSKKGKCFVIIRTAAARKRIAQVCKNSFSFKIFLYLKFSSKLNLNLILKYLFGAKCSSRLFLAIWQVKHTNWILQQVFVLVFFLTSTIILRVLSFWCTPGIYIRGLQLPTSHQGPKQTNSKDLYLWLNLSYKLNDKNFKCKLFFFHASDSFCW